MKKMAIAFQTFKKNLNKDFIKKGLMPDFEKHFQKQRPYWDAFVQYKLSEDSEKRTSQAKENMSKKKHFHTGDFQLAAASKAFLLCSLRLPKPGRWLACHQRRHKRSSQQAG